MGSLDNNIRLIRNETVEGGNTKERIAETFDNIVAELGKKVDKVAGKILSSNDFTNELRQKLEGLQQVDTSGLLPKGGYTGTAQDLKNLIDAINRILQSDDTDLDQLQEIVTYIKQNKHILSTLGISNIAGLVEALAAKAEKDHHHDERYAPKTHHHNEYALRTHRHNKDDIDGLPANIATTDNIKTAIEGIQIGGRNYYKSSTGFILSNNITLVSRDSNMFSLNNVNRGELRILNVINENNLWTCSFKARINSGVGKFKLDICDYSDIYIDVTTEFKFFKITEKISNFSNIYNFIDFLFINKGIYEIKDFKIEKGNTPTDWSPAPEDLATTEEVMRKITRTGYEVSSDTVIPQAQQNDTIFVKASCTLGLQNIEHLGSVSFIKTFDTGAVTFTCAGKTIIMKGDTQFNGGKGSTAVVSIHNNDCYIRISNV